MIHLKNIVREGNIIRCDYYAENGTERFYIVLNYVTGEIIEKTGRYSQHAKSKLMRLSKLDSLPPEAKEIWY